MESTLVPGVGSVATENDPIVVQSPEVTVKRTMKRKAEMGSTLVSDATASVSTGNGPVVVQLPTKGVPEVTVKRAMKTKAYVSVSTDNRPIGVQSPTKNVPEITVKRTMKTKVYVLVPRAPYRYRFLDRDSDTHQRSQADASTSALSVTRDELQHTVNGHEQRVPRLQVNCKVPKASTILKPSTPSLSDIGISIPTTVRKPGSFVIHTPQVTPRNRIPERLVEPIMPPITRPSRPPHVSNPVTGQVITKGSLAPFKFTKSIPSKISSSANNHTIVAKPSTQEDPSLPQEQPTLPSARAANVLSSELTASEIAKEVIQRFGFMLCQKVSDYFDLFFK